MYQVVKRTKQLNESEHKTVLKDTQNESFEDVRNHAKILAKTHSRDCMTAAPIETDPGVYQLFTSNYTCVTYSAEPTVDINKSELLKELEESLCEVKMQIACLRHEARTLQIQIYELKDASGGWVMAPFLLAKSQILAAMAALNTKK